MVHIESLADIPHRDKIMFTGGEPIDHIDLTFDAIAHANTLEFKTIYLYTARWHPALALMVENLNGIHFTLHQGATERDICEFEMFQEVACLYPDKSFRLAIDPTIQHKIKLTPRAWREIRVKHWRLGEECIVPVDETLYRLR